MLIRGKISSESRIANRVYWMLTGLCNILDGLSMVFSLGFFCFDFAAHFSVWRLKKQCEARKRNPVKLPTDTSWIKGV
jgi:hypothetical protein